MNLHQKSRHLAATGVRKVRAKRHVFRVRRPLEWQTVRNAVVVPYSVPREVTNGAGVVAENSGRNVYVGGTGVRRYSRELVPPPKTDDLAVTSSIPKGIFGGYLFSHFGHFLLESLSRLWIEEIEEIDASVPLLWISDSEGGLTPWMTEICRRIGLDREVVLVHGSTGSLSVGELLVPEAGIELREWMHPMLARRLGTTQWSPRDSNERIWLSRSGLGTSTGGLDNESEVERELAELGWAIVRPEDHSIRAQIELLSGASHIAGVEGSALHGLVLVDRFGGTVDVVRRIWNPTFDAIAHAEKWDQRWIDPIGGRLAKVPGRNGFTGEAISWPLYEGIDSRATAFAIDRSSRRGVRRRLV